MAATKSISQAHVRHFGWSVGAYIDTIESIVKHRHMRNMREMSPACILVSTQVDEKCGDTMAADEKPRHETRIRKRRAKKKETILFPLFVTVFARVTLNSGFWLRWTNIRLCVKHKGREERKKMAAETMSTDNTVLQPKRISDSIPFANAK